ncbi:hypothetical protein UPYG_G00022070 [Umbra pygmaea]|uniref:Uncharacterized protein n=1 Tax=Umbra pygmaea TaxID=75934 RepID=A0ABD0XL43_UMBPY
MSVPFKIPKRKQPPEADSVHMQSPLSRLQESINSPFKVSWHNGSSHGKKPEQVGSLNGHISRAGKETTYGDSCKGRLGPGHPVKWNSIQSTDFQRPGRTSTSSHGGHSPQHSQRRGPHLPSTLNTSPPCFQLTVNGTTKKETESLKCKSEQQLVWRPKRASDTLCQDKNQQTGSVSPPLHKMSCAQFPDAHPSVRCSPLRSEDEFESELSPDKEVEQSSKTGDRNSTGRRLDLGMTGFPPQKTEMERRTSGTGSFGLSPNGTKRTTGLFGTSSRGNVPPGHRSQSSDSNDCPTTAVDRGASSPTIPPAGLSVTRAEQQKRLSLSMHPLRANPDPRDRRPPNKLLSLRLRLRKPAPTSTEPIVLSSEDEEEGPSSECPRLKTPPRQCPPHQKQPVSKQAVDEENVMGSQPLPPIMELSFWKLHAGVIQAKANGNLVVTDDGITLPLKDSRVTSEEEGVSVSLVASQLRGYGVWDGGLAQGGSLFQDCPGRGAPFLLFFWVSDAQANLVQTELSPLHPITLPGQACPFLLLVLSEQLGDLQAALLASMLDVDAFRQGRSHDLKSPLSWADGLALIHSCPQDTHLLTLLGQSPGADPGTTQSSPTRPRGSLRSQGRYSTQHGLLPTRLIQYPPLPSKGRITVTTEDLDCLDIGQFLNDVIIDFYLKYLLLERAPGSLAHF